MVLNNIQINNKYYLSQVLQHIWLLLFIYLLYGGRLMPQSQTHELMVYLLFTHFIFFKTFSINT